MATTVQVLSAKNDSDPERGHLSLPPLEKQFLISPPASPPVGWEQEHEAAPNKLVFDFDLFVRLSAFAG